MSFMQEYLTLCSEWELAPRHLSHEVLIEDIRSLCFEGRLDVCHLAYALAVAEKFDSRFERMLPFVQTCEAIFNTDLFESVHDEEGSEPRRFLSEEPHYAVNELDNAISYLGTSTWKEFLRFARIVSPLVMRWKDAPTGGE